MPYHLATTPCKRTERAMGFEPTTFSLARRRTTTVLRPHLVHRSDRECRDTESNCGHRDFQSRALPTELSRPDGLSLSVRDFTLGYRDCQARFVYRAERSEAETKLLLTSTCFHTTMPAYTEKEPTHKSLRVAKDSERCGNLLN